MRWLYSLLGVLLLPAAAAIARTCCILLGNWWSAPDCGPRDILALAGGFGLWLLAVLLLPAPARVYVLAHEMTHALWGAVMGARLCGLRVSRAGGYVKLSEHNFLVALAPYFFPFYTVLILLAYWIYSWFRGPDAGRWIWLGAIGASLGFHYTFTLHALFRRQSDLRGYGWIFPHSLIFCGNLLGLLLLTVLLSGAPLPVWTRQLALDAQSIRTAIRQAAGGAWQAARNLAGG